MVYFTELTGDFPVNQKGIDYYNNLIGYIKSKGLTPLVTLFHWDLPQALEDEFQGWLDRKVVDHYVQYAEVAFNAFGDRVGHWLTFNEPLTVVNVGYSDGAHAPGRCSNRTKCAAGDSHVEPYIVGHNMLLSHAYAVKKYRELKKVRCLRRVSSSSSSSLSS